MGLLDRLHTIDEAEEEPEPPPETAERVRAILAVVASYMDPSNTMGAVLFTLARRELAQATPEQLDVVILGVVDAADKLRPFASRALMAPQDGRHFGAADQPAEKMPADMPADEDAGGRHFRKAASE